MKIINEKEIKIMSKDNNNIISKEKVNDDVAAFLADVALEEFIHKLETGDFPEDELADIKSMME